MRKVEKNSDPGSQYRGGGTINGTGVMTQTDCQPIWGTPQAGAVNRIRRRIIVCRKSAEKVRL